MELEQNEYKRALSGVFLHMFTWFLLCYMRRRYFTMPKALGFLAFNIFAVTFLYLQSYMLAANSWSDPSSKIIYTLLMLSDCFFGFFYAALGNFLYSSGHFGFCTFPKIFFAVSIYFFFDDRLSQVLLAFVGTTIACYFTGLNAEELILDCHHENIVEFWTLDYYTLLYLDIPYIAKKCWYGVQDIMADTKERVFGSGKSKVAGKSDKND